MKKLLAIMFVAASLTGCDKGEESGTNITVSDPEQLTQTVYADQTGGKSDVQFTTTGAWSSSISEGVTAKSSRAETPGWISIDPASGDKAGSYTINITLGTNLTGAKRSATITIICGGEKITITITQEAVTEEGEEPKPNNPRGTVWKINDRVIEYQKNGAVFSRIGDVPYLTKVYSNTEWAYINDPKTGRYNGWRCYFTYGNNGKVDYTDYYYYASSTDAQKTKFIWEGDKLVRVLSDYYSEAEQSGMRLDIEYGNTEYSQGNVDICWLVACWPEGNSTFNTPWETAIGVKTIPYKKLITKIVLTDILDDKYSSTRNYRYEVNSEGFVSAIYETVYRKLDQVNEGEQQIFKFEY